MTDKPPAALCANCLHPADKHDGIGSVGLECSVAIAVTWSDGPSGCECERFIAQGTACGVDGCDAPAVHFRVDASGQVAYDMCVKHYEEAEPYCERYYELTGSAQPKDGTPCGVDGCDAEARHYVLGPRHIRFDLCSAHSIEAEPYREGYYKLTGWVRPPRGTPCGVDGCGGDAVQIVADLGGGGSGKGGGGGYGTRLVCAAHYGEGARAAATGDGGGA